MAGLEVLVVVGQPKEEQQVLVVLEQPVRAIMVDQVPV
jgi:hypothetical protein